MPNGEEPFEGAYLLYLSIFVLLLLILSILLLILFCLYPPRYKFSNFLRFMNGQWTILYGDKWHCFSFLQGSASFLLGLFFIFVRWPIVGIIFEIYGCIVLFGLVDNFLLELCKTSTLIILHLSLMLLVAVVFGHLSKFSSTISLLSDGLYSLFLVSFYCENNSFSRFPGIIKYTHTHTHIHAYIHTHIRRYVNMYMHTNIYTHIFTEIDR